LQRSLTASTIDVLPIFLNATLHPRSDITSEHIVTGPGLGALLAQLVWSVCDEREGILITTVCLGESACIISF
jgi:1-aminocyclopropane-1-carboxylate synthase